jgi:predicted tellurium resistance membrane protein TerC
MQNLLFFSRVGFICNVCFVLAWLFKYYPSLPSGHMVSMVLILGLLVAFVLNVVVNGCITVLLLKGRPVFAHFPRWLIIINFLFLLAQIILFVQ